MGCLKGRERNSVLFETTISKPKCHHPSEFTVLQILLCSSSAKQHMQKSIFRAKCAKKCIFGGEIYKCKDHQCDAGGCSPNDACHCQGVRLASSLHLPISLLPSLPWEARRATQPHPCLKKMCMLVKIVYKI